MEWLDIPPADQIASIFFLCLDNTLDQNKLIQIKKPGCFFFVLIQEYRATNICVLFRKKGKKEEIGNCAMFSILNCKKMMVHSNLMTHFT